MDFRVSALVTVKSYVWMVGANTIACRLDYLAALLLLTRQSHLQLRYHVSIH